MAFGAVWTLGVIEMAFVCFGIALVAAGYSPPPRRAIAGSAREQLRTRHRSPCSLACVAGVAAVVAGMAQSDEPTGDTASARSALPDTAAEGRASSCLRRARGGKPEGESRMAVTATTQPATRTLSARCAL